MKTQSMKHCFHNQQFPISFLQFEHSTISSIAPSLLQLSSIVVFHIEFTNTSHQKTPDGIQKQQLACTMTDRQLSWLTDLWKWSHWMRHSRWQVARCCNIWTQQNLSLLLYLLFFHLHSFIFKEHRQC